MADSKRQATSQSAVDEADDDMSPERPPSGSTPDDIAHWAAREVLRSTNFKITELHEALHLRQRDLRKQVILFAAGAMVAAIGATFALSQLISSGDDVPLELVERQQAMDRRIAAMEARVDTLEKSLLEARAWRESEANKARFEIGEIRNAIDSIRRTK